MRKIVTLVFILISAVAFSQTPTSVRISSGLDVGAAFKKDYVVPSLTYYELLNLDANRIFSIGWTAKLNTFYGDNLNYTTAPAKLTREKSGFAALSAPLVPANLDTMRFDLVTATAINFGLRAQIRLGPVEIGAGADLLGVGFGKSREGRYRSSTGRFEGADTSGKAINLSFQLHPKQYAQPQRFNARLLGDNDLGSLSTEVYVRLKVLERLGVKAGYQWITTEMRASNVNIDDDNQRFRNRASMAYVALTFPFYK
ncbi:hypothetical protein GCM10028803_05840 [Larkinella knui]|uniref:Outer membrane protein beta-barrel domain-containing protein n=1 Tax=Larkinella knui TaxID=2025310 RepID=A0A3P1CK83_9BACT|nr:hypothetical protein [Larkinella knui]RRB13741.1 hypothetical protein EHT87_15890 [Larkinella knui]